MVGHARCAKQHCFFSKGVFKSVLLHAFSCVSQYAHIQYLYFVCLLATVPEVSSVQIVDLMNGHFIGETCPAFSISVVDLLQTFLCLPMRVLLVSESFFLFQGFGCLSLSLSFFQLCRVYNLFALCLGLNCCLFRVFSPSIHSLLRQGLGLSFRMARNILCLSGFSTNLLRNA